MARRLLVRGRQRPRRTLPATSHRPLTMLTTAAALIALTVLVVSEADSPSPTPLLQPVSGAMPGTSPGALPDTDATSAREAAPPMLALPASVPVRLHIPTIGVDSTLIELGLQPDGTLEVPPGATPAGWFTGAPTPGEPGPAIVVGHVDWGGRPGVFVDLWRVTPDDEIIVHREDGSTATFRVTSVLQVSKRDFPTSTVYGDLDHAGLRLITCGGRFDRSTGSYEDNIIVLAELTRIDR